MNAASSTSRARCAEAIHSITDEDGEPAPPLAFSVVGQTCPTPGVHALSVSQCSKFRSGGMWTHLTDPKPSLERRCL